AGLRKGRSDSARSSSAPRLRSGRPTSSPRWRSPALWSEMPSPAPTSRGNAALTSATAPAHSAHEAPGGPEVHVLHPSLVRPILFAGVEPRAAALEALTAG